MQDASKTLSTQLLSSEEARSITLADLRIEREWRSALQLKEIENKERISKLEMQLNLQAEAAKVSVIVYSVGNNDKINEF